MGTFENKTGYFFNILFDTKTSTADKISAVAATFDDCTSIEDRSKRFAEYADFKSFLHKERVLLAEDVLDVRKSFAGHAGLITDKTQSANDEDMDSLKQRFMSAYNAMRDLGEGLNKITLSNKAILTTLNILAEAEKASFSFGNKVSDSTEKALSGLSAQINHAENFRKSHATVMTHLRKNRDQL